MGDSEALRRAVAFQDAGADAVFLPAYGYRDDSAWDAVRSPVGAGTEPCDVAATIASATTAVLPPSTRMSTPVMKDAPGEQRNSTNDAISSGLPWRDCSGVLSTMKDIIGCCSHSCRPIGVAMIPGESDRTLAPRPPQARAYRSANRCTARLDHP